MGIRRVYASPDGKMAKIYDMILTPDYLAKVAENLQYSEFGHGDGPNKIQKSWWSQPVLFKAFGEFDLKMVGHGASADKPMPASENRKVLIEHLGKDPSILAYVIGTRNHWISLIRNAD